MSVLLLLQGQTSSSWASPCPGQSVFQPLPHLLLYSVTPLMAWEHHVSALCRSPSLQRPLRWHPGCQRERVAVHKSQNFRGKTPDKLVSIKANIRCEMIQITHKSACENDSSFPKAALKAKAACRAPPEHLEQQKNRDALREQSQALRTA